MLTDVSLWKQNIYLIDDFKVLYNVPTALSCGKIRYLIGICEIILKWQDRKPKLNKWCTINIKQNFFLKKSLDKRI